MHTFATDPDGGCGFMVSNGCNVNFDECDAVIYLMDAGEIAKFVLAPGQKLSKFLTP